MAPRAREGVFRRNIIRALPKATVDFPQATRAPPSERRATSVFGEEGEKISVKAVRDKWEGPPGEGDRLCSRLGNFLYLA